jgi:UDP-glucose:(heptosyl)LPS alpha-1,3-glucosyltransferase
MGTRLCIAVVSPFLDKRHGTERCVAEQVERLARDHGYEVHIYSQRIEDTRGMREIRPSHARKTKKEEDGSRSAADQAGTASGWLVWHRISDIPGPHVVRYLWWLLANQFRRWKDRQFGGRRYDLVYSPGINCLDADVIVVHFVFHEFHRRMRNELRLRNNPLGSWPRLLHRRLYYRLAMALEKRLYRNRGTLLAAISGLTASEVQRCFGRKDVVVIPNAVDLEAFHPVARQQRRLESRRRLGILAGDFVILHIGNDWKRKGLACLLEAVAKSKDLPVRLLVVGSDDRRPYEALLERLQVRGRVSFLEPSPDVLQFYAAADVYAGPSVYDPFSLPPIEAMACGLPVITSANAGCSEMITDGVDGFVLRDAGDSNVLAEKIRLLYATPGLMSRIAQNAAVAARRHRWEHNVEQTKRLLEQACRGRDTEP